MKKLYTLSLFLFVAVVIVHAAEIKGRITNEDGETLPYASIFVQETGSGTTTNAEGNYAINLPKGSYTLSFQFLGYATESRTVNVLNDEVQVLNIVLSPYALELKGVEVTDEREDPAYTVMRKAIAKAGYHRAQVETYTAKVYIKGTGGLVKSLKFVDKLMEKEGIDSVTFISESVSNITYERPNSFKEQVLSIRQQGENQGMDPSGYFNASFYEPKFGNSVSPLSPKAMGYYRFEFLGSHWDNGVEVNEIKVIPKRKGEGVFEGKMAIVEDDWSIYNLDLTTRIQGNSVNFKQFYQFIEEKAWLPTMQQLQIDFRLFGFGFQYNYLATVSEYAIELNPDLDLAFDLIDETLSTTPPPTKDKAAVKSGDLEEALGSGEELKMKDLRKLIKIYDKLEREQQEDKKLEAVQNFQIDSNAYNRDTAFWRSVRPVPLTAYEQNNYRIADSIAIENNDKQDSTKISNEEFKAADLILGNTYQIGKSVQLIYKSPLTHLNFNTVESYHIGTDLGLRYDFKNENTLQLGVVPRYSSAQQRLRSKYYLDLKNNKPSRVGNFRIEGGTSIAQLNRQEPINPYVNTIYSLLFEQNYMKILGISYVEASLNQQISDRLKINFRSAYIARTPLQNSSSARPWAGEETSFTSDAPENVELGTTNFEAHEIWEIELGMEWKPWRRYRLKNGEKQFTNKGPILFTQYRKGGQDADYDFLEGGIQYTWERQSGNQLDLQLKLGGFLNNRQVFFPDFKHFSGNQTIFLPLNSSDHFRLFPYYQFSTREGFINAHAQYQFRRLALTQFPLIWMLGLKESLFINYLDTPNMDQYVELGYGIANIFKFLRLELVASFQDTNYQDFGIRIGIAPGLINFSRE